MKKKRYDVVLWGCWSERNYGSELTYYALWQVLRGRGYSVLMTERPHTAGWAPNSVPVLFGENPYEEDLLVPENKAELRLLNGVSNTFLVGSDQIWHGDLYDSFGRVCYLDYVYENKKKVAYAASFGREYWKGQEDDQEEIAWWLSRFDAVSVRETSGAAICRERFGIDAQQVMDPVFLCDRSIYMSLAERAALKKEHHIGAYILDVSPEIRHAIVHAERTLGKETHIISDVARDDIAAQWDRPIDTAATIEDWLANIIRSDYVITDSFHGVCFAIIFRKPFIAFGNVGRGRVRFVDLLKLLHLEERLLDASEDLTRVGELLHTPVDYSSVELVLEAEIARSKAWLWTALRIEKSAALSEHILLRKQVDALEYSCEHAWVRDREIQDWHTERLDYHNKIVDWHTEWLGGEHQRIEDLSQQVEHLQKQIEALSNRSPMKLLRKICRKIRSAW